MKYFTPKTSNNLRKLGLVSSLRLYWGGENTTESIVNYHVLHGGLFSTLDICELDNSKKLWGEEDKRIDELNQKNELMWKCHHERDQEMERWKAMDFGEERDKAVQKWCGHTNPYVFTKDDYKLWKTTGSTRRLEKYITLTDEERVKYVEDYLQDVV